MGRLRMPMALNAYEGKGDSAHLIDGTTLNVYEGNDDFARL